MPRPKAPHWRVAGDIPEIDPRQARDEQLDAFDEDMLQMTDPTGRYTVDVGWYPAGARDGQFMCRVIISDDWERPMAQMETPSMKMLWAWLRQQINTVTAMMGDVGTFTAKIGFFLYHRVKRSAKGKAAKAPRLQIIETFLKPLPSTTAPPTPYRPAASGVLRTTTPSTGTTIGIGLKGELALHAA